MIPHLVEDTSATEWMVHTQTTNTLVLLVGVVLAEVEGDMRGWGLNLVALPREILYQL